MDNFEMFCENINYKREKILNDIYNIKRLLKFKKITRNDYYKIIDDSNFFEKNKLYPLLDKDRVKDKKYWGFHASYFDVFNILYTLLNILKNNGKDKPKLIDIGCGIGNIIQVTNMMGYESFGIELLDNFIEYHNSYNLNVTYGDVFDNMNILRDMDVIYLYQPFYNDDLEIKFLNKLFHNTKDDVVVVYTHLNEEHPKWDILYNTELSDSNSIYSYILMKNKKYLK